MVRRRPAPLLALQNPLLALGLEGSANKLGVGVVRHNVDGTVDILSNVCVLLAIERLCTRRSGGATLNLGIARAR